MSQAPCAACAAELHQDDLVWHRVGKVCLHCEPELLDRDARLERVWTTAFSPVVSGLAAVTSAGFLVCIPWLAAIVPAVLGCITLFRAGQAGMLAWRLHRGELDLSTGTTERRALVAAAGAAVPLGLWAVGLSILVGTRLVTIALDLAP